MNIRPEFQQFISGGSWGKQQGFYEPSMEELQAGAFEIPLDKSDMGAMSRAHLDFLNIGHNVEGFNELPEATRKGAQAISDRNGTWAEVEGLPEGQLARIHMSNVHEAQRSMLGNLIGPGFGVMQAMEALAPRTPNADGRLVSIGMRQGSENFIAADLYPLNDVSYMGQTMKGITEGPIGRVYVDLSNGTAFMMPDDKFHGRS